MSAANVTVAVRCRPWIGRQNEADEATRRCIVTMSDSKVIVEDPESQDGVRTFEFDHAIWSHDPQDGHYKDQAWVYNNIGKKLLDDATVGYNSVVFAYGQTGSGKTFSMAGSKDQPGITPLLIGDLFKWRAAEIAKSKASERINVNVKLTYCEIYMEKVHTRGPAVLCQYQALTTGCARIGRYATYSLRKQPASPPI